MDDIDRAQEADARFRNKAITAARKKATATGPSSEFCEECGGEIPAGRREAQPGCTLCVQCQSVHERLRGGM